MKKKTFLIFILGFFFYSCSSFKIENVKYGWAGEYFGNPDDKGNLVIQKSSISFNVMEVLKEEKLDAKPKEVKIRVIRDDEGYYYLTAHKFLNVWVFTSGESLLKLENKIKLFENQPLDDPKFNEQKPNVKLFLKDGKEFILNKDGIVEKEKTK